MLKTYLYVPEEIDKEIKNLAEIQKVSKAVIIRNALKQGLGAIKRQNMSSARILLKLAEIGKKYQPKGPKDASTKIDKYLWSKNWSRNE